jgi:hypothetical protein
MTLDRFCSQAWNDHATDATGVFARLPDGIALVTEPSHVQMLAGLIVHVAGEHLGRWTDGIALLDLLAASPHYEASSPAGKALLRSQAVLFRCAGDHDAEARAFAAGRSGEGVPEASDRIRVLAVAAAALVGQQRMGEARTDFEECVRLAAYRPAASDPAARALAVTANNLAAGFENRTALTDDERAMMIRAAEVARQFWEIAGGWLETERAEYRLAMSHLKAGDAASALLHAAECLRIVETNGSDPGETFFAREALSRGKLASGDIPGARGERDAMAKTLPTIEDEDFRSIAAEELAKLDAALNGR